MNNVTTLDYDAYSDAFVYSCVSLSASSSWVTQCSVMIDTKNEILHIIDSRIGFSCYDDDDYFAENALCGMMHLGEHHLYGFKSLIRHMLDSLCKALVQDERCTGINNENIRRYQLIHAGINQRESCLIYGKPARERIGAMVMM